MTIKASENVYGFIRGEEDFRAEAYDDGFGNPSIGYGMTTGGMKRKLTKEEADRDMRSRVAVAEQELSRVVRNPNLTQQQKDVMVDMHFNMGLPNMKGFIELVNNGDLNRAGNELLRYVHAEDKKTGQKVVAPGLQKRANRRLQLWKSMQAAGVSDDDIMKAINTAKVETPQNNNDELIASAISAAKSEGKEMAQQDDYKRRSTGLQLASEATNSEDALRRQEAKRLVKQLGIPMDDAMARLSEKDSKTILADHARNTIAEFFPAVAQWGQDPDNYNTIKETGDWTRKVELAARSLNKDQRSDRAKALDQSLADVEEAAIWPQVILGRLPIDVAKKALKELDQRRRQNQLQDSGAQEINQAIANMDNGGDIWDVIATMAKNPRGTALIALQSGGSSVAPLIAGIIAGAAGSLATPVVGVATGMTAAFSTGHLLSFSAYMKQQFEQFRNPKTGEIDYDQALSDPARLKQWQREADVYGGVMGASDAFYSAVGGKFLLKHLAKGGVKNAAKGLAVGTAVKAAEEGLSETTALTATDLYAGRLTDKKLKKNIKEGQVEAVFGAIMGGPIEVIGAGVRTILEKPKDSAVKTMAIVNESKKANEDLTALSTLRAVVSEQEGGAATTKEIVESTINPPTQPEDPNSPIVDDIESLEDSEMRNMDNEAEADTVYISPSEWDEYHKFQGKDPIEALRGFSPLLVQEYARNKQSDTSFVIPIADWLEITEADPAIDAIARVKGNNLNGIEANEYAEGLEGNEQTLFDRIVYHGSPHRFDKFKETAIGTGEGAQAYGHGLYFTEDRGVAEWYKSQLEVGGTQFPRNIVNLMDKYNMFGFDTTAQAISAFRKDPEWHKTWDLDNETDIATINEYISGKKKGGQVFEVKLPKGLWMDMASTLDSVPAEVLEDLRTSLNSIGGGYFTEDYDVTEVTDRFRRGDKLVTDFVTIGQLLYPLNDKAHQELAVQLAAKGYNGITYIGLESGKRNFVVFSEDDAKIVQTFYERNPDELPPTPDQDVEPSGGGKITIIEADPEDKNNLAMRPVELVMRGRSDVEGKVFNGVLSRLKKSMNDETDPGALEYFSEIQFRHMKNRAEMLGVSVAELDKKLRIGKTTKGESQYAHGVFKYQATLDSPYTVAFAQSADMKTLVHEFGHSWLHEMAIDHDFIMGIPEDNLTDAQREYKKAMQIMAEKSGLENISKLLTISGPERTRVHETFAQTTELYFLEGKFADAGMKAVLESFRKWMIEVIERIKAMTYKQYPPLKITPEVERMFEAILGVSAKVEEEIVPMFPEPMFDPAMLGPEGAKYLETIKDARSLAIGEAYAKSFNKSLKEREKMIDQEINRIYDEATLEVDSQRSMILFAGFKEAYAEYQNDPEGNTPDPRFSFESFTKILANGDANAADVLRAQIPREVMAGKKKGGMPVDQFMLLQGINKPQELLDMLLEMGKREDMIAELVDRKIAKEFPAMKTDEEIHQIAVDSINAGGKEKLLMAEVKILMTKYQGAFKGLVSKLINPPAYIAKPSKETIKNEASMMVLQASALKFSANKFLVDSYRHGRDASRKFKKNNIEEAFESKLKEAVHFFGYQFARNAQKEIANTRVRVKQFIKYSRSKDVANKYDADVMAYGRQVIQAVGTAQPIPAFTTENFSKYSGITTAHVEQVNRAISAFNAISQGRTGEGISVGAYMAFGDLLKSLTFIARKAKQIENEGNAVSLEQTAYKIEQEIGEGNVIDMSNESAGGTLRRSLVNVRSLFESLYSSPEAFAQSSLGKIFYTVVKAEAERSIALSGYRDRISKAVRLAAVDMGIVAPLLNRLPVPAKWRMDDKSSKPIFITKGDGFNRDFTFKNKGELHMAMLLMGSESGAKKFLLGHNLAAINPETMQLETEAWNSFVERMIADGTLTKKDFEMYSQIWKIFDEIHPKVKDAMRRSDGFNMGYIQGWKVKNSLGEFDGGYVPVTPARDLMSPGPIDSMMEVDTMGYRVDGLYPRMNTGMTNERTESYSELNLDMSRINTYLGAALNIAYLRNPLMDFGKVVESFPVRTALEKRRPGAIGDAKSGVIVRWFNAVKQQEYTEYSDDSHELVARKLREHVNLAMYLGGFTSMVKQFFGTLPAISKVGAGNMAKAVVKTSIGASKESREIMMQKSAVMRNRLSDSQEQMVRSWDRLDTNFDWINWTDEKVKGMQWFLIQMTQNMVDTATWHAGYERAIGKGLSEQDAINFADDAVSTTQGAPDVTAMSNIQRGKDSWKLITMVSSVPIAMHNLMQAEYMRDQSSINRARAIVSIGMLAVVLPAILDGVVSDISSGAAFEEEDEDAEDSTLGVMALRTTMGSIDAALPILSRPVTSAIMYGAASTSPALSRLNKLAQTVKASEHIVNGVDLSAKEVASLMDTLTIFTGKPFSIIGKAAIAEETFIASEDDLQERKDEREDQIAALDE